MGRTACGSGLGACIFEDTGLVPLRAQKAQVVATAILWTMILPTLFTRMFSDVDCDVRLDDVRVTTEKRSFLEQVTRQSRFFSCPTDAVLMDAFRCGRFSHSGVLFFRADRLETWEHVFPEHHSEWVWAE